MLATWRRNATKWGIYCQSIFLRSSLQSASTKIRSAFVGDPNKKARGRSGRGLLVLKSQPGAANLLAGRLNKRPALADAAFEFRSRNALRRRAVAAAVVGSASLLLGRGVFLLFA